MGALERTINGILDLLERDLPPPQLDAEFCHALTGLFQAEFASIFDCLPDRQMLKFRCAPNLNPAELDRFEIRYGEGICGAAAMTGKTLAVYDARNCPQHYGEVDRRSGLVTRSLLAAPAMHRGACLAVVEVMNRKSGHFSKDEQALARCLATIYAARLAGARPVPRESRPKATNAADIQEEPAMIGAGFEMDRLVRLILKTAPTNLPVLILGETGTGKELVAGRLHRASARRQRPFVPINCAALQETLLESELFGHAKGAFTGADRDRTGRLEEANGGTVFLDEIGDMSLACQAKLLRAIEYGEVIPVGDNRARRIDVRLIAATHQPLSQLIKEQKFRQDLYYRIRGIEIRLPPLRERIGDLELLIRYFIEQLNRESGKFIQGFTPEVLALMKKYSWPGNIRELRHAVACAHSLAEGQWLTPDDLPTEIFSEPDPAADTARAAAAPQAWDAGRRRILKVLGETAYPGSGRWNITRAAKQLGIARKTLDYQIKSVYRLQPGQDPVAD